jgi:hypothetical protein
VSVETLGEALRSGWRVKVRCAFGERDGLKSIRECQRSDELDLGSLAWTRGRDFPIARLAERLMCPDCGSRRVHVMFQPPAPAPGAAAVAPLQRSEAWLELDRAGLQYTVCRFGPGGSVDRILAAAVNNDLAQGAFEAAIKREPPDEGYYLALRQGNRSLATYPPSAARRPELRPASGKPSEAAE